MSFIIIDPALLLYSDAAGAELFDIVGELFRVFVREFDFGGVIRTHLLLEKE